METNNNLRISAVIQRFWTTVRHFVIRVLSSDSKNRLSFINTRVFINADLCFRDKYRWKRLDTVNNIINPF